MKRKNIVFLTNFVYRYKNAAFSLCFIRLEAVNANFLDGSILYIKLYMAA